MPQRARIARRIVETAKPQARRVTIADTELAGFCLRIEPAGVKTFFVRYRADGGGRKAPQRFMAIGRFPALSVDDACR